MRRILFGLLLTAGIVHAEEPTAACKTANAPVEYDKLLNISSELNALVESYRSDWRAFCGKGPSRPLMGVMYGKAYEIEKKFAPVIVKAEESLPDYYDYYESPMTIEWRASLKLHRFIPAFLKESFTPSKAEFKKNASRGTAEDRLFFASQVGQEGMFSPWFSEDYCVNFGKYNWSDSLKKIAQLRKKMKSAAYLGEIDFYLERMIGPNSYGINPQNDLICACDETAAVVPDLKSILVTIDQEKSLGIYRDGIEKTLKSIESGQTIIGSHAKYPCVTAG